MAVAGGPARPDGDLDDWFAESDSARPRRAPRTVSDEPAQPHEDGGDDWLAGGDPRAGARAGGGLLGVLSEWRIVVVLATLGVLLIAGLAIGGVFSSGHRATSPPTQATTARPATTATRPATTASASTPVPTTTLKPGDIGTEVKTLQQALKRLGYTVGTADSVYGPSTQSAVARFQTASQLTSDGVFGPATLAALVSALRGH